MSFEQRLDGADQQPPIIDWRVPPPRSGWRGAVDRFFGPGQTRAEVVVQVVGIAGLAVLVAVLSAPAVDDLALPWWSLAVLGIFVIDALGGVLTNSTGSAKRWYHRPGTRVERLAFVATHLVHLVLLATLVLDGDWRWLALNAAVLAVCTLAIEFTPISVARPVATGLTVAAVLVNAIWAPVPDGLQWMVLLLYMKLLLAHMTPEAPFRD